MAQALKYKKPRRINVVSVSMALGLALVAYLTYQYLPMFLQKQEAFRILEETGSTFAGRRSFYVEEAPAREKLHRQMDNQLRVIGIDDPDMETWVEVEGTEVRFGVVYSVWLEWPFNVIEKQEVVYEVEHTMTIARH